MFNEVSLQVLTTRQTSKQEHMLMLERMNTLIFTHRMRSTISVVKLSLPKSRLLYNFWFKIFKIEHMALISSWVKTPDWIRLTTRATRKKSKSILLRALKVLLILCQMDVMSSLEMTFFIRILSKRSANLGSRSKEL